MLRSAQFLFICVVLSLSQVAAQAAADTGVVKVSDSARENAANASFTLEKPEPHYPFLRDEDNWEPVCAAHLAGDGTDRLKCLAWNPDRRSYVSIAGEAREAYETYRNQEWGQGPQDSNGWVLERYLLSADWHIHPHVRLFGELQSGLENGRNGGPHPYDKDKLDIHQFFLDLQTAGGTEHHFTLRLGRQEMSYGLGRLVNTRYGLNTRISFDGAKLVLRSGDKQLEVFATRPTFQRPGFFNDVPDGAQTFWGIYFSRPLRVTGTKLDLYYFGLDRRQQAFVSGTGHYQPETLGTRLSREQSQFTFDEEANIQIGSFAGIPIRAWSVSTQNGYKPRNLDNKLLFGARVGASSGNSHTDRSAIGTFNPLFPRGKYFQQADLNGPSNSISLIPAVEWQPTEKLKITPTYGSFWRYSLKDGLYNYAGQLLRPSTSATSARHVGQLLEVDLQYQFTPRAMLIGSYEQFFAGGFLHQAQPDGNVRYFSLWYDYHF